MERERPDPDQLLRQMGSDSGRGRMKVFLGASAGVGKTFAMLSEAHEQLERGVDIVIGYVETHGRAETQALVDGIESIPLQTLVYKGVKLKEFDLDAARRRKPAIIIIDELPHTNAPGSRHPKRWQDIEELLACGISVYTAVNIQHIESLGDIVAQITGVMVRETVPDAFLEKADDVELIDIPPEELRQRLREGKVYVPDRIDVALDGFFKKQNLLALRELALRRAADQVEAETLCFREGKGAAWATRERVLVCIAPNRLGEKVVKTAARLGTSVHAELFALFVESDRQIARLEEDRERVEEALRMAERLGMETARRAGRDIVAEILAFAQSRNITLIIVGKPIKQRWKEILYGSVVDELVRRSGDISVHVLTSEEPSKFRRPKIAIQPVKNKDYAWAVAGAFMGTVLCLFVQGHLPSENFVAIYLLAIAYVGSKAAPQASFVCCLLSVAAYDFFFVSPIHTFNVGDARYIPTFAVMLVVALLISNLTLRMRKQAELASSRERRTAALYDLTRELSRSKNKDEIASATVRRLQSELNVDGAVLIAKGKFRLTPLARSRSHFEDEVKEQSVAQWVFDNGKAAGAGTDTLPSALGTYFPLSSDRGILGVLAVKSIYHGEAVEIAQHPVLQTFATSMTLALERATLAKESHEAKLAAESERVRSALLGSVSHDIRTPLTVIRGAAAAIAAGDDGARALAESIVEQSDRLNRHVRNLLDLARLESGSMEPKWEWHAAEELVGNALSRTRSVLSTRQVSTEISPNVPLVKADGYLVELALSNLLENAAKYTPIDSPIELKVLQELGQLRFMVMDRGPGIPESVREKLFDSFNQERRDSGGFGLGLSIANSAMKVQGGSASMTDRPEGGSIFSLVLPVNETPPEVPEG